MADQYGRVYGAPDERSKHKNGRPFIAHIVDIGGRHAPNVNKGAIDDVGKADSSLIAAAPELLSALEDLLSVTHFDAMGYPFEEGECPKCDAARKAIARAKGGA